MKLFMFLGYLSLSVAQAASGYEQCVQFARKRRIRTKLQEYDVRPGIRYQRVPHAELIRRTGKRTVLGLTESSASSSIELKTGVYGVGPLTCVYVEQVIFRFGYQRQNVFIDNRYRPGSCEYEAIMTHEKQHVNYNEISLEKFRGRMLRAVRDHFRNRPPLALTSNKNYRKPVKAWLQSMQEIPKLYSLQIELRAEQDRKHQKIDTQDSYAKVRRKCSNW